MFWNFFRFEIRYWLRGLMVYVFMGVFALIAFLATQSDNVVVGASLENTLRNAPFNVQNFYAFTSVLASLVVTAFVNASASRDFIYSTEQLVFTKPLQKFGYLMGRFCGSALIALVPLVGISLGIIASGAMPTNDPERWGPISWGAHLWGILVFAVPNVFFISAIVFAIAVWTRSTMASFIGIIVLLIGFGLAENLVASLDNERLGVMLDPFGLRGFNYLTKYWTSAERNSQYVVLGGMLLWNRVLWVVVGAAIFGFAYAGFSFTQRRSSGRATPLEYQATAVNQIAPVRRQHDFASSLNQLGSQIRIDFWGIVRSPVFIVIMLAGMANMIAALFLESTQGFGLSALPVTYNMIDIIRGAMYAFLLGVMTFYAGVLVWRERDSKLDEVFDALPHPTWITYTAKLIALIAVVLVVQFLSTFCVAAVQAVKGYYRFQPGLYVAELFVLDMVQFLLLMVAAMLCHIVSPNKYIGYFAFVIIVIANAFAWNWLDIATLMVQYGNLPSYTYSDMFGHAPFLPSLLGFGVYWVLFAGVLAFVSVFLWQRGSERRWSRRLVNAGRRWRGPLRWASAAMLLAWMGSAVWVYYNTLVLNTFRSPEQQNRLQVEYEKEFKKHEPASQPRVVRIKYDIDIFPAERGISMHGEQTITNKSQQPINTIYINTADRFNTELQIERATLKDDYPHLNYRVYSVNPPMEPGETLSMSFTVKSESLGFENSVTHQEIVQNGTFFNNMIAPQIGYQPDRELRNKNDRRRYELAPAEMMPDLDPDNLAGRTNTYLSNNSDWVDIETEISTSADQIAIAPGSLQKTWVEGDRRYFHYKVDHPSLNFYAFISARYKVARDKWNDVDVEVYYHPEHEWNVPKMIKSIHKTLDYCSTNFGQYRHRQARIIEFPRIAEFAQAFPGTMPYSEGIGFIAEIKHSDDIDMVYYVVAHEMAHQWWAHQVAGANMKGATLLSETLAQYSALMVMEKEYGRDMMRKFLQYEMDRYLSSRGSELLKEQPLLKVEANQGYVHYRKGSVVMYFLKEMIGEDKLNAALRSVVDKFGYQGPPFPTSVDLVDALRAQTPEEFQYLYKDLFEQITLYGNRAVKAVVSEREDGKFNIELEIDCHKFVADEEGAESEVPLTGEWIEIGAFAKLEPKKRYGKTLYRERVKLNSGTSIHTFVVDERPALVGVDPFALLIDRVPDDNMQKPELVTASD